MSLLLSIPRYTSLLFFIIFMTAIFPVFPVSWPTFILELAYGAVLVSAVLPTIRLTRYKRSLIILTILTLAFRWYAQLEGLDTLARQIAAVLTIVLLCFISCEAIRNAVSKTEFQYDSIISSIVVYFFIIYIFAEIYLLIYTIYPDSFSNLREGRVFMSLLYFSMATISSNDKGVFVVENDTMLAMSLLQSIFGMFYVTVLIAWLVGLNVSRSQESTQNKEK